MAENGSNGAWHGDTEGCCSTFVASSLCESAKQKVERPRKHEGSWYLFLL